MNFKTYFKFKEFIEGSLLTRIFQLNDKVFLKHEKIF